MTTSIPPLPPVSTSTSIGITTDTSNPNFNPVSTLLLGQQQQGPTDSMPTVPAPQGYENQQYMKFWPGKIKNTQNATYYNEGEVRAFSKYRSAYVTPDQYQFYTDSAQASVPEIKRPVSKPIVVVVAGPKTHHDNSKAKKKAKILSEKPESKHEAKESPEVEVKEEHHHGGRRRIDYGDEHDMPVPDPDRYPAPVATPAPSEGLHRSPAEVATVPRHRSSPHTPKRSSPPEDRSKLYASFASPYD